MLSFEVRYFLKKEGWWTFIKCDIKIEPLQYWLRRQVLSAPLPAWDITPFSNCLGIQAYAKIPMQTEVLPRIVIRTAQYTRTDIVLK